MKFYTLTTDTDSYGRNTGSYPTLGKAEAALFQMIRDEAESTGKTVDLPEMESGNWSDAWDFAFYCACDHAYIDEFEIEPEYQRTVHILATDGKDGTQAFAFNSKDELNKHIWDNYVQLWDEDSGFRVEDAQHLGDYYRHCGGDWSIPMDNNNWQDMLTISIEEHTIPTPPDHSELLRNASSALDACMHQISQMDGMFSDDDGTIAAAVEVGESAVTDIQRATVNAKPSHIRSFIDCSTAHVSMDAKIWLNERAEENADTERVEGFGSHHVAPQTYGWWLYVSSEVDALPNHFPNDLKPIADYARNNGCLYILFDGDAEVIEGVPVFGEDEKGGDA